MKTLEMPPPPTGTTLATLGGMWTVMRGWRGLYVFTVMCNVISHLGTAVAAGFSAYAVGSVVLGRDIDFTLIAVVVAAAVIVRGFASWGESWISHDVSFRIMARFRGWVFAAIGRIAPLGIARRKVGDVATTALSDAEALEVFLAHSSIYILSAWVTTPILAACIAVISPLAAALMIPFVVLTVLVTLALRRLALRSGAAQRQTLAALASEVQEDFGAVREITADGLVAERLERLTVLGDRLTTAQRASMRRSGFETAVAGIVAVCTSAVGAITGVMLAGAGALDPILAPVLAALGGTLPAAILQWIGVTRHYGATRSAASRIEELLDAPTTVERSGTAERSGEQSLSTTAVDYAWPHGPQVLHDVTTSFAPGEVVAICGASGAGKSTLAAVLARLVDPDAGVVRVGDIDVRELAEQALAESVSLVPQDSHIFRETVRDNLLLASAGEPSDEELWSALDVVGAGDLVRNMPQGLDTMLDDRGRSLSGGERQRLALARSIVADAQVIVLDESVSQLDVSSEMNVSAAMERTGRTTIVIAHRLSTLLRADRILVMHDGRVVGEGTHATLRADSPHYRALVEPQLVTLTGR